MNNRTLIYTCCDETYSHFIPLFCAALLYSNNNIDIEIGVSCDCLTNDEEHALNILRDYYVDSRILIKYNFFECDKSKGVLNRAMYNNKECMINTVRFISEPIIKDYYTYISDIDIISFDNNFYEQHIINMKNNNMSYSNIVRKNTLRMTGLHFCITHEHYPLLLDNINLLKNDEEVLLDIVAKKKNINYESTVRPVHGIHMSPNRKSIATINNIPGWGADKYIKQWRDFTSTTIYKEIYNLLDSMIIKQIEKLETYYISKGHSLK